MKIANEYAIAVKIKWEKKDVKKMLYHLM